MVSRARVKDFVLGILTGLTVTVLIFAALVVEDLSLSPIKMISLISFSQGDFSSGAEGGSQNGQGFLPENDSSPFHGNLHNFSDHTLCSGKMTAHNIGIWGCVFIALITALSSVIACCVIKCQVMKFSSDGVVAAELSKKVRVLVWVLTSPKTLWTKAQAIKNTWAKRCNVILYFSSVTPMFKKSLHHVHSSVSDSNFPAVGLGVPEGRSHLTAKTMAAFRYIYEKHLDDADWFMKADDDTYVIVENLRHFLSSKDTNEPAYYGHLFQKNVKQGYYSGGGGYVVSKEALRRFGKHTVNSTLCVKDGGDEDVDFGSCMEKLGVKTFRTTDEKGRSLFHPYKPQVHFLGQYTDWHLKYTAGIAQKGFGVSRYAVTFHYASPEDMVTFDFFFYHIRAYGTHPSSGQCNQTRLIT